MYGSTRLMFLRNATAKPSAGSAIDHIGFSVADLDAKMKEWEAAGIKVTTPVRDVPKLFKLAFLEDPWGTRIEVVQDPELLGLHHLHLRNPNPDEGYAWLLDKFGGKRQQLKGMLDAVRYDYEGFSSVWILITKGEAEPSRAARSITSAGARSGRSPTPSTAAREEGGSDVGAAAADAAERSDDQLLVCRGARRRAHRIGRETGAEARTVEPEHGSTVPGFHGSMVTFYRSSKVRTLEPRQNETMELWNRGTLEPAASGARFYSRSSRTERGDLPDHHHDPAASAEPVGAAQLHVLAGHRVDLDRCVRRAC